MTKLRIASDLHLEHYGKTSVIDLVDIALERSSEDSESVLVLAGDITGNKEVLVDFISRVENRFKRVIYIPGNHEYYRNEYHSWNLETDKLFQSTLTNTSYALATVNAEVIDGTRFIYGTMWADGGHSLEAQAKVSWGLNDFRVIKYGARVFTVSDMREIHARQKKELMRHLLLPHAGKTVVVTHHMPTYRLCHPRFGDEINGGFAANCEDIIAYDHAPDVWVYGHTHDSYDGVMWSTRLVANPMGYPNEFYMGGQNYNTFKDGPKFIEV